jgi:hypothetical protein
MKRNNTAYKESKALTDDKAENLYIKAICANRQEERQRIMTGNQVSEQPTLQSEVMGNDNLYSGSIGLLMPNATNGQADENYFEKQLKRKKKKQRKISL